MSRNTRFLNLTLQAAWTDKNPDAKISQDEYAIGCTVHRQDTSAYVAGLTITPGETRTNVIRANALHGHEV